MKIRKKEMEVRVIACKEWLRRGHHRGEIKRMGSEAFKCSTRSVEKYMRRAQNLLIEQLNTSKEEQRAMDLETISKIIRESDEQRVVIEALKRKAAMLGLDAPSVHHVTAETHISSDPVSERILEDEDYRDEYLSLVERAQFGLPHPGGLGASGNGSAVAPGTTPSSIDKQTP